MNKVQLPQKFVIRFSYAGRLIFFSRNETIKHDTSTNQAGLMLFARLGRKCIEPAPLQHVTPQLYDRYKPTNRNSCKIRIQNMIDPSEGRIVTSSQNAPKHNSSYSKRHFKH